MRIKWTEEAIRAEALKYPTKETFAKGNKKAYDAAWYRGIFFEVCAHMPDNAKAKWLDIRNIQNEADKYTTRGDFQKKSKGAYLAAYRGGLLDQVCAHMDRPYNKDGERNPAYKYDDSDLILAGKAYETRKTFFDGDGGAYHQASRRGLLEEACAHMPVKTTTSMQEKELLRWLQTIVPDFKTKKFGRIYEIDCFSPSLKLGIEFNGLYWHSNLRKPKNYHLDKTKYFESKGIRIIHMWQNEWCDRKEQVQNYLISACKANSTYVGARKCKFKEIDVNTARNFLNETHIQGAPQSIKLALGCFLDEKLLSVATFGINHRQSGLRCSVLNRFACLRGHSIQGGLAKFTRMAFNKLGVLQSWADYCKSQGNGYVAAGWTYVSLSKPSYFYADRYGKVISKQSRQKKKIGTPSDVTEFEHALRDNLMWIWDCGKILMTYDGGKPPKKNS